MEPFKRCAFTWDPEFSTTDSKVYETEDQFQVQQQSRPGKSLTTDDIVDAFLSYGCDDEVTRYGYRREVISGFVRGVQIQQLSEDENTKSSSHILIRAQERPIAQSDFDLTTEYILAHHELCKRLQQVHFLLELPNCIYCANRSG